MGPAPDPLKGDPTFAAALKTLKRLQDNYHGVIETSDIRRDEERAALGRASSTRLGRDSRP